MGEQRTATTDPAAIEVRHSTPRPSRASAVWTAWCLTCEHGSQSMTWAALGVWVDNHVRDHHGPLGNGSSTPGGGA